MSEPPATLKAQLEDDAQAWLDDTPGGRGWFQPKCSLLAYFRAAIKQGDLAALANSSTLAELLALSPKDHLERASKVLTAANSRDFTGDRAEAFIRCAAAMQGMLAGVEAAIALAQVSWQTGQTLPAVTVQKLQNAVKHYTQAWGLTATANSEFLDRTAFALYPRSIQAMLSAVPLAPAVAPPAWAGVARLLAYLLGEEEPAAAPNAAPGAPGKPIRLRLLLAGGHGGVDKDLHVSQSLSGPRTWFFDPVALGLTVLLPDLVDSIRLGWAACRSKNPVPPPVRLTPSFAGVQLIDGPSAGALVACGLYAAITGEEINDDASASVALVVPAGLPNLDNISLNQIQLGNVGDLDKKIPAAIAARLERVCLIPAQVTEVQKLSVYQQQGKNLSLRPVSTLDDVFRELTGNSRIEKVLRLFSDHVLKEWAEATAAPAPGEPISERNKLYFYVPPAYRLFVTPTDKEAHLRDSALHHASLDDPDAGTDQKQRAKHVDIDGPDEEKVLLSLLERGGRRLCISEGPGAGKTTFTRRLQAFLSSQSARDKFAAERPLLAVRFEDSLRTNEAWPDCDFITSLQARVEPFCAQVESGPTPAEVIRYALKHDRLFCILDALDQTEQFRPFVSWLHMLKERHDQWRCRVVLTGRTYAIDQERGNLQAIDTQHDRWTFGAILPFDFRRQHRYLLGPETGTKHRLVSTVSPDADEREVVNSLSSLFQFYSQVRLLLGNPNTLYMIRQMQAEKGRLTFRNRSELYCEASQFMLAKAYERKDGRDDTDDEQIARWQTLLAAAAFQLMQRDPKSFRLSGKSEIAELRRKAGGTITYSPAGELWRPVLEDWKALEKIAPLTRKGVLYDSSDWVWAFPDRRMMEFYCGLHLARNSEPSWVDDPGEERGPIRCGNQTVREHAADPDWAEAFKFAQEMPAGVRDERVLLATLAELFEPVTQPAEGGPWLRPTELIYRSWCLLEKLDPREQGLANPVLLPGGERVLRAFRGQFQQLLTQAQSADEVICQLVPLETLIARGLLTPEQAAARTGVARHFAEIPATPSEGFLLGDDNGDEQFEHGPAHLVSLKHFLLATTTVTREQYALFDFGYLKKNGRDFEISKNRDLHCPANNTCWQDAWCFSRWCGGRLPTEAEWEYACRAGSSMDYCRIFDSSTPEGYRDLATVEGLVQVAYFGNDSIRGPQAVGLLTANAWGLFDMHGNVFEWCGDWYDKLYYTELVGQTTHAPRGPLAGLFRVNRGGSFFGSDWDCLSADRFGRHPENRDFDLGFRLALVPSSPARKAEPAS